jgi:hypothetical protein
VIVTPRLAGAPLLLLLGLGCQPGSTCPAGTPCGGDPSGTWNVADGCRDPVFAGPVPVTYLGQPAEMARQPRPTMTSSDWCSSLFIGATAVTSFTFPHDTLSPAGGHITYASDNAQQGLGSYQAVINTSGRGGIDLSPTCLERSGVSLTCEALATQLRTFAALKVTDPGVPCSDSPSEPPACQFYFSYSNIDCGQNAADGCRCEYDVSFAGALHGRWSRTGTVLTHSDDSKMLPSQADYCVGDGGGTLSLWGHDRTSLLNQNGIRTLLLQKAP